MQPRGRYVKLNAVDYILIVSLVLLILTLPIRGILYFSNMAEDRTCEANVEFVIRRVDESTRDRLQNGSEPFCTHSETPLPTVTLYKVTKTTEYVTDENGEIEGLPSADFYDVHFTFLAEGTRAADGTFLLFGNKRLSVGDSLALTRDSHSYRADVISVRIS